MEQGLGDMIQFIRYLPLLKERGGTVLVECPPFLMPLFSRCRGIDQLIPEQSALPPFDVQAPIMSLPAFLDTRLDTVPATVPYLFPDEGLVAEWRQRIQALPGFKIGIVWQGNPYHPRDRWRSIPLSQFAALQIPGVELISLQHGPGTEQLDQTPIATRLTDDLDKDVGGFMGTAAVMKNLDLVISVDTAATHLAGGLGVPVWLLLSAIGEWRWMVGRDRSPWYPTLRLFRQTTLGQWGPVFERLAEEIEHLVSTRKDNHFAVPVSAGELFDKISILEIKTARITDVEKRRHVSVELDLLRRERDQRLGRSEELDRLVAELRQVNEALWEIEDDIRVCERDADFGPRFVELARSVYTTNDRRSALKRQINDLLGSAIVEEKEYAGALKPRKPPT
jgi:hypothetical protein